MKHYIIAMFSIQDLAFNKARLLSILISEELPCQPSIANFSGVENLLLNS
jgi:hypothetical protein